MAYPTSLDDLSSSRASAGSDKLDSPDHLAHHVAEDTAIQALEAKVGITGFENFVLVAGDTMSGMLTITIPDTANIYGLVVNQNDVTNNPTYAFQVNNACTGRAVGIFQNGILGLNLPAMYLYSGAVQADGRGLLWLNLDSASSMNVQRITNAGTGDGLFIDQNGNGIALHIDNDGTANTLTLEGTTATDLILTKAGYLGIGLTPTANMAGLSIEAGRLTLKETTTPTADADYGKIYTKNDNKLYFQDGAGVEHEVDFAV